MPVPRTGFKPKPKGYKPYVGADHRSATSRVAAGKNAQRGRYSVKADLRSATLSSSDPLLHALIHGRSPTKTSVAPTSLLEVFHDPLRFKNQYLTALLADIAGRLIESMESHLERMPLDENGKGLLDKELLNYRREANKKRIQDYSIKYGVKLLQGLGYEFEQMEDLGPVREFLVEVISLAQVGIRLCSYLEKKEGKISEDNRIVDLAHFHVVLDLILEKAAKWNELRREEANWSLIWKYYTAEDMKRQHAKGQRSFKDIRLFGPKGDRDLSRVDLCYISFEGADLRGVNLSGTNLKGTNLQGANLDGATFEGATINYRTLSLLNKGEWAEIQTPSDRINKWRAKGGKLDFSKEIFGPRMDFSGADLSSVHLEDTGFPEAIFNSADLRWAKLKRVNLIEAQLQGANLSHADLSLAMLDCAQLQGADLSGANLSNAVFRYGDLRGANLFGANLDTLLEGTKISYRTLMTLNTGEWEGIKTLGGRVNAWTGKAGKIVFAEEDLTEVDLRGANLRGADLNETNLSGADLREADFWSANLSGANFKGADLRGAMIDWKSINTLNTGEWEGDINIVDKINFWRKRGGKIDFNGAILTHENLSGADFRNAWLYNVHFFGANLSGADFSGAHLTWTILNSADLSGANFKDADLRDVKIDWNAINTLNTGEWEGDITIVDRINFWRKRWGKLDFCCSDLSGSDYRGVNFRGAELRYVYFHNANLSWVDLSEADLDGAKLIGTNLSGALFSNTRWLGATIDPPALKTLDSGIWRNLSYEEKVEKWRNGGGKIDYEGFVI